MHCRQCGYALWNLSQPRCPECGTGFDLRSYIFTPNTVAFACPHCGHLHGGVGEHYLPSLTDAALCHGCGQAMQIALMRVVPLVDDAEAATGDLVPWEERGQIGRWRAWWRTTKLTIGSPVRLATMLRPTTPLNQAYWYAAWTYGLGYLVQSLLFSVFFAIMFAVTLTQGSGLGSNWLMGMVVFAPLMAIVMGIIAPFFLVIIPGTVAHWLLRLMAQPAHSLSTTLVCGLYAQGPNALAIIPFCMVLAFCASFVNLGLYAWALALAVYFTVRVQRVSVTSAIIAWLVLPVLIVMGMVIMILLAILA